MNSFATGSGKPSGIKPSGFAAAGSAKAKAKSRIDTGLNNTHTGTAKSTPYGSTERAHSFVPGARAPALRPGGIKSSQPYKDSVDLKSKEVPIRDEGLTYTINLDKMADNKFGFKTQQQQDEAYEAALKKVDELAKDKKALQERLEKSLEDKRVIEKKLGSNDEYVKTLQAAK